MLTVPEPEPFPDTFWILVTVYCIITALIIYCCVRNVYCLRHHSIEPDSIVPRDAVVFRHSQRCRRYQPPHEAIFLGDPFGDI